MLSLLHSRLTRLSFALALLLMPCALYAQINVPADQPTIQAGIDAAIDGNTVLVAPGTYFENISFNGKEITVRSSAGAATTIIDGSKRPLPTVTFVPGTATHQGVPPPTILDGFTIRNGGAEPSLNPTGGILITNIDPIIRNNVITHNHCAGIYLNSSLATVQNNEIDNTLDNHGDCFRGGGSGIVIGGMIGRVGKVNSYFRIVGNTIQNNTQGGQEGEGGGGITAFRAGTIQGNILRDNSTASFGGGLYLSDSGVEVVQNVLSGNQAACGGGAIATRRIFPLGTTTGPVLIVSNTIVENSSTGGCGATSGGNATQILYGDTGSVDFVTATVNNIVLANDATPSIACGIGTFATPGIYARELIFDHNLFRNTAGSAFDSSCMDPTGSYGNIAGDPQFTSPTDFHLRPSSPAIDSGNTSELRHEQFTQLAAIDIVSDFDGNPRPADATHQGYPQIDIGAFEAIGTTAPEPTAITLSPFSNSTGATYLAQAAGGDLISLSAVAFSSLGGAVGCLGPVNFLEDGVSLGKVDLAPYSGTATLQNVFLSPGIHRFVASYGGQAPCSAGVAVEGILRVSNYAPTLTLTSTVNPALLGSNVGFTATIKSADPNQGGPITLTDASGPTLLATLAPNAAGMAVYTTNTLALGSHDIVAASAGDATHNAASTSLQEQIVNGFVSSVSLVASANPAAVGQPITFKAAVTTDVKSGSATGSVAFTDSVSGATLATVPLSTNNGSNGSTIEAFAGFTTASLAVGTHVITATYLPTGGFVTGAVSVTEIITLGQPVALTMTCSPNPAFSYQPFAIGVEARASGATPTGSITLSAPGATSVSGPLAGGVASLLFGPQPIGSTVITATYTPDPGFAAASTSCSESVVAVPTTSMLSLSSKTIQAGDSLTMVATVAGDAVGAPGKSGVVIFKDGAALLGSVRLGTGASTASFTTSSLPVGNYDIACVYTGDTVYAYSTCDSQTVIVLPYATATALAVTPSATTSYKPVVLSAHVTPGPPSSKPLGGFVDFTANGANVGHVAVDAAGNASATVPSFIPNTYAIVASYSGNAGFAASLSSAFQLVISPVPTAVTFSTTPSPAYQGQAIALLASVSAPSVSVVPTGQFQFAEAFPPNTQQAALGAAPISAAGNGSISISTLSPGVHTLIAGYVPQDSTFASSLRQITITILAQDFAIAPASGALTIATEHHADLALTLTSIGNFSEVVALSCTNLPAVATCSFHPGSTALSPNGSTAASVTIDTDAVLGFKSLNARPLWSKATAFRFATLFPLGLLILRRRRGQRRLTLLGAMLVAAFLAGSTGCSGKYPDHTPPGTYSINVVGSSGSGKAHTAVVMLTVIGD